LVPTGLLGKIYEGAVRIDLGRKGFAIEGKERDGRISYEKGIATALSAFMEASNQRFASAGDPETIFFAEYAFISQELQLCDKSDKDAINSLTNAIQGFDDAFLALEVVDDKNLYQAVEKTHPHRKEYRVKSFPKDAFHIACLSHITRIKNVLRFSGIAPIEKALLKQRLANLYTAQNGYIEKQRIALAN
jgi:hypothetical protein